MYTKTVAALFLIAALFTGCNYFSTELEFTNNQTPIAPAAIDVVPLAEQVGQLFTIGHWPHIPTASTTQRVQDLFIGSVIVMKAPATSTDITTWTETWKAVALSPLLISIDQEGGVVSRLRSANHNQTAQPQLTDIGTAYDVAATSAQALLPLGINANYAPVLDLSVSPDSFMYPRVFRDPTMIALLGDAMVRGYQDNGVIAVPKHFPGHPDTSDDSHITLPVLDLTTQQYIDHTQQFTDIIATGNVHILMTAHVLVPALDPDFPTTVSPAVIADLRERIGYTGVIVTDDLAMQAISDRWSYEESAVLALKAGVDMLMMAAEPEYASSTVAAVIAAVETGELSEERVFEAYTRVMKLKQGLQSNNSLVTIPTKKPTLTRWFFVFPDQLLDLAVL
jgi:beta-N-acetylhexosaminidase